MEDAHAYLYSGIAHRRTAFSNFWIWFPSKQRREGWGAKFRFYCGSYLYKGSTLSADVYSLVFLLFYDDIFISGAIINI